MREVWVFFLSSGFLCVPGFSIPAFRRSFFISSNLYNLCKWVTAPPGTSPNDYKVPVLVFITDFSS